MKSDVPKVAHVAAGRAIVNWVLKAAEPLQSESTVVVVGHGADEVRRILPEGVTTVTQDEQLGTGHATQVGLDAIGAADTSDVVLVLYGDTPMLSTQLLAELAGLDSDESLRMITADVPDPSGYGRVLRDAEGRVTGIVEEQDCTPEQRLISEVNAGIYAVRHEALALSLEAVTNDNAQGEYYLTDVVGILAGKGDKLTAVKASAEEVVGINSQHQLADARKALQLRTNRALMESGVWMLDPERTYIDETVTIEEGAKIYPGVHLEGNTVVGKDARIGPDAFVVDSEIGAGSTVWYAVVRSSQIGEGCEVGPYASLRPGTVMKDGSKLGTFVETKNTTMGEGAKAGHQAYLGDATVGARANIGAGTVTCNYDGYQKHPTEIGEDAFIGSDTMLVAPVSIGDRAVTGAGSVITRDVADDALAVERSGQKEIPGYSQRREAMKKAKEAED